jgi:hypothetical protein
MLVVVVVVVIVVDLVTVDHKLQVHQIQPMAAGERELVLEMELMQLLPQEVVVVVVINRAPLAATVVQES